MNENIDLTQILKDCPKGWEFYSSIHGWVYFEELDTNYNYPVTISYKNGKLESFGADGRLFLDYDGECVLFPSKNQRDWSKFTAPWYKKEKFDPKTLKPFDKVLVRDSFSQNWTCGFFSHIVVFDNMYRYNIAEVLYKMCIPYNDDTKHLAGTTDEAPEYYRYWED